MHVRSTKHVRFGPFANMQVRIGRPRSPVLSCRRTAGSSRTRVTASTMPSTARWRRRSGEGTLRLYSFYVLTDRDEDEFTPTFEVNNARIGDIEEIERQHEGILHQNASIVSEYTVPVGRDQTQFIVDYNRFDDNLDTQEHERRCGHRRRNRHGRHCRRDRTSVPTSRKASWSPRTTIVSWAQPWRPFRRDSPEPRLNACGAASSSSECRLRSCAWRHREWWSRRRRASQAPRACALMPPGASAACPVRWRVS
jgi:hypothetical protein